MKTVLIVEDDVSYAMEVQMTLEDIGELEVVVKETSSAAKLYLMDNQPDVIIADIYLENDESSLDWLTSVSHDIPVMVLTGRTDIENYTQSRDINAVAYLVKPVNAYTLKYNVEKALSTTHAIYALMIKQKGESIRVPFDDVLWVKTEGNYSTISTVNQKYKVKKSLKNIQNITKDSSIVRVQRSVLINLKWVDRTNFREERIMLLNGDEQPLGKKYKDSYRQALRRFFNTL